MGLFSRDPKKKLQQAYEKKLLEARDAQRSGNIQGYADLMEEAEALRKQLES